MFVCLFVCLESRRERRRRAASPPPFSPIPSGLPSPPHISKHWLGWRGWRDPGNAWYDLGPSWKPLHVPGLSLPPSLPSLLPPPALPPAALRFLTSSASLPFTTSASVFVFSLVRLYLLSFYLFIILSYVSKKLSASFYLSISRYVPLFNFLFIDLYTGKFPSTNYAILSPFTFRLLFFLYFILHLHVFFHW